jgi:hypothetical protein
MLHECERKKAIKKVSSGKQTFKATTVCNTNANLLFYNISKIQVQYILQNRNTGISDFNGKISYGFNRDYIPFFISHLISI